MGGGVGGDHRKPKSEKCEHALESTYLDCLPLEGLRVDLELPLALGMVDLRSRFLRALLLAAVAAPGFAGVKRGEVDLPEAKGLGALCSHSPLERALVPPGRPLRLAEDCTFPSVVRSFFSCTRAPTTTRLGWIFFAMT